MAVGEPHKPVEHKLTADEAGMQLPVRVIPGSRLNMSAHPTDFKYSEAEHPRGDGGKWVGAGNIHGRATKHPPVSEYLRLTNGGYKYGSKEAEEVAQHYIPSLHGSFREAWMHGFHKTGKPQVRGSAAAKLYQEGRAVRESYEKEYRKR